MTFCRRNGSPYTASSRMAGTLALTGCLIAVQSPAFAQDIESRVLNPVIDATTVTSVASVPTVSTAVGLLDSSVNAVGAVQLKQESSAFRSAAFATIAGSVFDSVTTIRGLNRPGARESNPILGQNPARIVVMKSLLLIPQLLAEKRLVDTGHPKAARWLGLVTGGFAAGLAVHNIKTTR